MWSGIAFQLDWSLKFALHSLWSIGVHYTPDCTPQTGLHSTLHEALMPALQPLAVTADLAVVANLAGVANIGLECGVDSGLECGVECCTPIQFFGWSAGWSASIHTPKILEC